MDFSPDGKYLALSAYGNTTNIYDWTNGRIIKSLESAYGTNGGQSTKPMQFSPDGTLFASCTSQVKNDVVVRIWGTQSWNIQGEILDPVLGGDCRAIGFTPDGRYIIRLIDRAINKPGDSILFYDAKTFKQVWGLKTAPFYPSDFAVNPKGGEIAVAGVVANPRSWPFNSPIPTFGQPPERNGILFINVDILSRVITRTTEVRLGDRIAWSPSGDRISVGGPLGVDVFDVKTGAHLYRSRDESGNMNMHYSPDGKYIIENDGNSDGDGFGIKIWSGDQKYLLQEIHEDTVSLAISRDGKHFAAAGINNISIWKLK